MAQIVTKKAAQNVAYVGLVLECTCSMIIDDCCVAFVFLCNSYVFRSLLCMLDHKESASLFRDEQAEEMYFESN